MNGDGFYMGLGRRALRHHEGIHRLASQVTISGIRSDAPGTRQEFRGEGGGGAPP